MAAGDDAKREYAVLTQKGLYDLIWSETFTVLTKRFGLSHKALTRICEVHRIPTPGRGYWSLSEEARNENKVHLRARLPASPDTIRLGKVPSRYKDIPIPSLPVQEEEMSSVRSRMTKAASMLNPAVSLADPVPKIARYLKTDEARKRYQGTQMDEFFGPKFQEGVGRRRLSILNWLSKAAGKLECKLSVTGADAETIALRVGTVTLDIVLTSPEQVVSGRTPSLIGKGEKLCLAVRSEMNANTYSGRWTDGAKKLEQQLHGIFAELLTIAEDHYRERRKRNSEWAVQEAKRREVQAIKDERQRQKWEAESLRAQAAARIERLQSQASTLRLATDIREYVTAVQRRTVPSENLSDWVEWALEQADRIDPVLSELWKEDIGKL